MQRFYYKRNGEFKGSYDGPVKDNPFKGLQSTDKAPPGRKAIMENGKWKKAIIIATAEGVLAECRRRVALEGHDLLALKGNTDSVAYRDACITAYEILSQSLPVNYRTSAKWPKLPGE